MLVEETIVEEILTSPMTVMSEYVIIYVSQGRPWRMSKVLSSHSEGVLMMESDAQVSEGCHEDLK